MGVGKWAGGAGVGRVWGGRVGECGALPQSNICISKVIHTALPIKKDCLIVLINGSAWAVWAVCVWHCVCECEMRAVAVGE